MTETEKTINGLTDEIEQRTTTVLNEIIEELDDYEIVWKQLQDTVVEEINNIITEHLPNSTITIPSTKSTYPDFKFETDDGIFAIDIKTNESQKNPWFDMGRVDTYIKDRYNKYEEEWELVIKYNSETKRFVELYFLKFREVLGIREECSGVKYRPKDGNLRPKIWNDFTDGVVYWDDDESLLKGIKNSQIHRWYDNISKHVIPILDDKERKRFRELFKKKDGTEN